MHINGASCLIQRLPVFAVDILSVLEFGITLCRFPFGSDQSLWLDNWRRAIFVSIHDKRSINRAWNCDSCGAVEQPGQPIVPMDVSVFKWTYLIISNNQRVHFRA